MSTDQPFIYLNGHYTPANQAKISPFDRGYMFADAAYEVIPVTASKTFGLTEHLQRLNQSLQALAITQPDVDWQDIITQLIEKNMPLQGDSMLIYIHVTRGVTEKRDHSVPADLDPTILVLTQSLPQAAMNKFYNGISAITATDMRWNRCDIKSTSLLASVMHKQQAMQAGVDEALLIRDGYLMEGTASNAFIVKDNNIYTPPITQTILAGITRAKVIKVALDNQIPCHEQPISAAALADADEIWITSSTKDIVPIIMLDGQKVGDGSVSKMWHHLFPLFQTHKTSCLQ